MMLKQTTAGLPDREDVLFALGMSLYNEGDFAAAVQAFRNGLTLCDRSEKSLRKYTEALSNVASQLDFSGALDEAIELYQFILTFTPDTPNVLSRLAMSYADKMQVAKAVDCIVRAKQLDPKNALTYIAMGYLMLTLGNDKEAASSYQEALNLDPSDLTAIMGKASALMRQKDYLNAAEALQVALEEHPDNEHIYNELGSRPCISRKP